MRFLGLGLTDKVPDAKTIWAFRERLTKAGAIAALFARFDRAIREAGYIPMSGPPVSRACGAACSMGARHCGTVGLDVGVVTSIFNTNISLIPRCPLRT
jgi:hypothetical protein